MNVYIDIETLPSMAEGELERITAEVKANFKAPSTLTKTQAGADLGMEANALKFTSAPEVIKLWEERFAESKAGDVAMQTWRKQALSADAGQILSIGYKVEGKGIRCISAHPDDGEYETLAAFWDYLVDDLKCDNGGQRKSPYFIGHNVPFDLEFIWKRSVILGVKCLTAINPFGRHNTDFYDNMQQWAGFKGRISQDRLAGILGIEQKPSDITGSNVFDHYMAGNIERIKEYNIHDVETVEAIYNRIK
jgi:3'-5' exonuclease